MKMNFILPRNIWIALLASICVTGCSIALDFIKDHFPAFHAFEIETAKFEFTHSLTRFENSECPNLRGIYSIDAHAHEIIEWKREIISDRKDTIRAPITNLMRIRKRNFKAIDALPEFGMPNPDVFWINQGQNGNSLEIGSWIPILYPDSRMDGITAIAQFNTNNKEFSCKNGYIHFNQFLYITDGALPRPGTFPAGMTLGDNGNLLYFIQGTRTKWVGNFFTGGNRVYFFDIMYEYPRVIDNQQQNQVLVQP